MKEAQWKVNTLEKNKSDKILTKIETNEIVCEQSNKYNIQSSDNEEIRYKQLTDSINLYLSMSYNGVGASQ